MKKIAYQQMTPPIFTTFCNILLWMEIGPAFVGYEAPGRDGGIDGEYIGNYRELAGRWRFQYKLHQTDRKTGVKSIKAALVGEISKLQDEDHFVLLTNVAFNRTERNELYLQVKTLLAKCGKGRVQFELWDDGVLQRLSHQYPLLEQWIDPDTFGVFLLPYQKVFAKRLTAPANAINTLGNTFVSRSAELQSLQNFFESTDSHLFIIKGEVGIGKTRLAIEFFRQSVDAKQNWRVLAVNRYNLDINRLAKALNGRQNYIVLVDDAHQYKPTMLADMKRLADYHGEYAAKFIFTMRTLQSFDALRSMPLLDGPIPALKLDTLSPEATKELIEKELSGSPLRHYIDELAFISRGRPILIVGILQAAAAGKKVAGVKSNTNFSEYVLQYFEDFLNRFVQQTSIDRLKAKNLLKLCCLLEPFPYHDKELHRRIAETEKLEEEYVEEFFTALGEASLSGGDYKQSIRPDYYSDVYLQANAKKDWVSRKMAQYKDYQANILINLASIDEVENNKPEQLDSLLDQSLQVYLGELKLVEERTAVAERMDLAADIAFLKPARAIRAAQDFVVILGDATHFLGAKQLEHQGSGYNPNSDLIAYAKRVIRDVLFYPEYHEPAFRLLLNLYTITGDKDLINGTFSFSHPTYLQQYSVRLQQFFVDKCQRLLPGADDKQAFFLLDCLKELLELQLSTVKSGLLKRHTISVQTHYLPKHEAIETLRLSIMDVLIDVYHRHPQVAVRFRALHLILNIPREISANKSSPCRYESDAEVEKVLCFLEGEADSLEVAFRKEVLDELHWYKRQRVHPKYHSRIDKLNERLQPQTLTQQIIQHLMVLEQKYVRTEGMPKYRKMFEQILANNEPQAVADALEEIWSSRMSEYYYFWELIDQVCSYSTLYAKAVYLQLKTKNRAFIQHYGYTFLRTFRCTGLRDFYQHEVDEHIASGSEGDLNTILKVYSVHAAKTLLLDADDKNIIATIFPKRTDVLGFSMASTLALYHKQDSIAALPYIKTFLGDCNQFSGSHLYLFLEDEIPLQEPLSTLLLQESIRFELDHNVEQVLVKKAKGTAPNVMFSAFLQRFERKMLLHTTSGGGYCLVPTGERDLFADGLEEAYRLELHRLALKWFVHIKGDYFEESYAEDLLGYLRPSVEFTMPCAVAYIEMAVEEKDNYSALFRLIESLKMFHIKTPVLIHTLSFLLRLAEKAYSGSESFLADIHFVAGQALTCVGCKHGKAGQPFESDIQLHELLTVELESYADDFRMTSLMNDTTAELEQGIEERSKEEQSVW